MKKNKKLLIRFILLIYPLSVCAKEVSQGSFSAMDDTRQIVASLAQAERLKDNHPTLLNKEAYQQIVAAAQKKINRLTTLPNKKNANAHINAIVTALTDIPYLLEGAMGEGDWSPTSLFYQGGARHIKQDPVYRFDGLNCLTFVQVVLALHHSNNITQFEKNLIYIAYGAADHKDGYLHYYNRNHFVDGDFNPVNQRNGKLIDVTSKDDLSAFAKTTSATITRQHWFAQQLKNKANVRVLSRLDAPTMTARFNHYYAALSYPHFDRETVTISYLPKTSIALLQPDGHYQPNVKLLNSIPLPAIAEVIRDAKKWQIKGKNIKEIIGSETSVSHLGLLYRQSFPKGEVVYRKITCASGSNHQAFCTVIPITCQETYCSEVMFAHVTYAYPQGYFWYQKQPGQFVCSKEPPRAGKKFTTCNRVEKVPLFAYLTNFHYGRYINMDSPSILGIHIEKLT